MTNHNKHVRVEIVWDDALDCLYCDEWYWKTEPDRDNGIVKINTDGTFTEHGQRVIIAEIPNIRFYGPIPPLPSNK